MRTTPLDQHRRVTGQHHQQQAQRTESVQRNQEIGGANEGRLPDIQGVIAQHLQLARSAGRNMEVLDSIVERAGQLNTRETAFLISALLLGTVLTPEAYALGVRLTGIALTEPEVLPNSSLGIGSVAPSNGSTSEPGQTSSAFLSANIAPI